MPVGHVADEPAAEDHVVGHLGDGPGQEFDLQLFAALVVDLFPIAGQAVDETDLAMGVFDRARDLGDVADHFVEHGPAFEERRRAVIALLALGREKRFGAVAEKEKLDFPEGLQFQARGEAKAGLGLGQDVVGGEGRGGAVTGDIAADEVQAVLVEGIEERRPERGHDIEVGLAHVDHALEERGAVHPLPLRQDGVGLFGRGHGDLQLLELAVGGDVMEGDAFQAQVGDELEEVGAEEIPGILIQQNGQAVGQGVARGRGNRHNGDSFFLFIPGRKGKMVILSKRSASMQPRSAANRNRLFSIEQVGLPHLLE